jgi:CMP-N-acetylneuraminic acid synthetase
VKPIQEKFMVGDGMDKILGIIQARGGSKGIPKKNIKEINGKPLISYTIEEANKTKLFHNFVVSSDDIEILDVSKSYGAYPLQRPDELSGDTVLSVDSLHWAVLECEKIFNIKYDYVVELPCVCPLRKDIHIKEAVNKLIKTGADSVISVNDMTDKHPTRMKRIIDDKIEDFCSEYPEGDAGRRQDLEPCYIRNGGIYSMKRDTLINDFTRHGEDSRPYVMGNLNSVNIDTMIDFKLAEVLLKDEG